MHSISRHAFAALILFFLFASFYGSQAQTSLPYQKPPQAIIDLVDTRPTPGVEASPGSQWLLIESYSGLP